MSSRWLQAAKVHQSAAMFELGQGETAATEGRQTLHHIVAAKRELSIAQQCLRCVGRGGLAKPAKELTT